MTFLRWHDWHEELEIQIAGVVGGKGLAVKEEMFVILYPIPAQAHGIDTIKVVSKFVFANFAE